MSLTDLIVVTGTFLIITFPGVLAAFGLLKDRGMGAVIFVGLGLGLVWAIFAAFLSQPYFPLLIGVGYVLGGALFIKSLKDAPVEREGYGVWIFLIAAVAIASRVQLPMNSLLPLGDDSIFHLMLAKIIYMEGSIPVRWEPFEAIKISYPMGLHAFLSSLSHVSGVELHDCFKAMFPLLVGLCAAFIYLVAKEITGSVLAGAASAMVYAFLANFGTMDYYMNGELPAALGMTLFILMVWIILACRGVAWTIASGFILCAIALIHNHSLFASFIALIFALGYYIIFSSEDEGEGSPAGRIAGTLLLAFVVSSPFLLPRIASELNRVALNGFVLTYDSTTFIPIVGEGRKLPDILYWRRMGLMFTALSIPGLIWLLRKASNTGLMFLMAWIAALVTAFGFFEYIVRMIIFGSYGDFFSTFSPQLFLKDLAYPLSICAGFFIYSIVDGRPKVIRAVVIGALVVVCGLQTRLVLKNQLAKARTSDKPSELNHLVWEREFTEPNALIVRNSLWTPYFAYREGTRTMLLPTEDINHFTIDYKRKTLDMSIAELWGWAETTGRPTYLRVGALEGIMKSKLKLALENPDYKIYKYEGVKREENEER